MNVIDHVVEPSRLYLVWQAPADHDRTRRVVGELTKKNSSVRLKYLLDTEDFEKARKSGFVGIMAFKPDSREHDHNVLEILKRRLPPRSREDFPKFLENFRLKLSSCPSDFALLGYTEAKLPGDGFSVVNDYSAAVPPFEFVTEIAGFRYYAGMKMPFDSLIGEKVSFAAEPTNQHDSNAVRVDLGDEKLGYVSRVQAPSFVRWLDQFEVSGTIDRVNGTPERPSVHVFVSVRGH